MLQLEYFTILGEVMQRFTFGTLLFMNCGMLICHSSACSRTGVLMSKTHDSFCWTNYRNQQNILSAFLEIPVNFKYLVICSRITDRQ